MLALKLKKQLRQFTAEVSAELKDETLVLIGHSGCGKSTLLKMLSGLLVPDEGEIHIGEHTLYSKHKGINIPPEERNIGYVFQNYALFPHLSVRENVAYGLKHLSHEERHNRVDETLSFLEIEALADSKPPMLSGGEQQRVALARALVTQPKVLLLDEPLSALDVSTRSRVRLELKELLEQLSIPTIIVTHDFEDARVLADQVAVMDQGKIIQSGTQEEISRYPASSFVAQFTGTNLLKVDNESTDHVAFDPWKVKLSIETLNNTYQWRGRIRDINFNGGFIRLQVIEKNTQVPFHADIPIEDFNYNLFKVGSLLVGYIDDKDARPVHVTHQAKIKETKRETVRKQKPKKRQWNWKWIASGLLILLCTLSIVLVLKPGSNSVAEEKTEMLALVAANATEPFNDLMDEFEKKHPNVDVQATFAGTQIVRTQLEQGANADLFLSADLGHIEAVQEQGLVEEFFDVSKNSVTIVVPKDNPLNIKSLEDLGTKDVKLVIGTDTVPIGKYTRQVFKNAVTGYGSEFPDNVMENVVSFETNVKQVLQKVSLGEAESGMVYPTDVTPDFAKNVKMIEVPDQFNIVATNYISVTKKAPNPELANEFREFMLSEKGQEIFKKYGYKPVE